MNPYPPNTHALPPKFRLKLKIPIPSPITSAAVDEDDWELNQSRSLTHGLPSPVSTSYLQRNPSPLPIKAKRIRLAYKPKSEITPTKTPTSQTHLIAGTSSEIDEESRFEKYDKQLTSAPDCISFFNVAKSRALSMMHYALSTNAHLKQNYTPVFILGYGGCGIVFEAVRQADQQHVAIKIIYKSMTKSSLPSEVNILSRINHTNIVKFKDHFEDSKAHYLVMEKFGKEWRRGQNHEDELVLVMPPGYSNLTVISGTSSSLFEYIDYCKVGRVPVRSLKPLFKQIASALAHLHERGIVHGDIKEENILIGSKSNRLVAKICDFGHAYVVNTKSPRMRLYGTRVLTPPELLNHMRFEHAPDYICTDPYQLGYKQDVWALGIVLWTMIHGSLPPENEFYIKGEYDLSRYKTYPTSFSTVKDPCKQ